LPGSHANAARHFLCQAPANRVDEMDGHAVGALCTVGKLARQASSSSAKMSERDPTLEIFSRPREICFLAVLTSLMGRWTHAASPRVLSDWAIIRFSNS
jgi:hypothetical protein